MKLPLSPSSGRMAVLLFPALIAGAVTAACSKDSEDPAAGNTDTDTLTETFTSGTTGTGPSISAQDPWKDPKGGTANFDLTPAQLAAIDAAPTGSGAKPKLYYPLAGALYPRNMLSTSVQFVKGDPTATAFRIDISSGDQRYSFAKLCDGAGCDISLADPGYRWFFVGQHLSGKTAQLTIRELGADGKTVTESAPIDLTFSEADLLGALYYWAAKSGSIKRANLGSDQAEYFITPNSKENDQACGACHSVSRDGSTISFTATVGEGESVGGIRVAPTLHPDQPYFKPTMAGSTQDWPANVLHDGLVTDSALDYQGHNSALSPDGKLLVVNGTTMNSSTWPTWFALWDARTGKEIQRLALGQPPFPPDSLGILPEFSPDGKRIAFTMTTNANTAQSWSYSGEQGGIWIHSISNTGLGTGTKLVEATAGQIHAYPTWSPKGDYLAFVTSNGKKCDDRTNKETVLNIVPTTGGPYTCPGAGCVTLSKGMVIPNGRATWPKFAPFAQDFKGGTGNLTFLSYTSQMPYGIYDDSKTMLWLTAIDLSALGSGDGSFAPMWLPYQDVDDGALAAFWAEGIPCASETDANACPTGQTQKVDKVRNTCSCVPNIYE